MDSTCDKPSFNVVLRAIPLTWFVGQAVWKIKWAKILIYNKTYLNIKILYFTETTPLY